MATSLRQLPAQRLDSASTRLKALAHPQRLLIVSLLRNTDTELSVTQIYTQLGLRQAIASQHLVLLKDRGLLASRKSGTQIFYSVADQFCAQVVGLLERPGAKLTA